MKIFFGLLAYLFAVYGCATLSPEFQPAPTESHGMIKAGDGIFLESVDEKHFGLGIYGYKGDVRISPGEHVSQMHYDSPGILAHYTGSKLPLAITVKEGMRYHIGAELEREFGMVSRWRPAVVKEEEIEGYWEDRPQQ